MKAITLITAAALTASLAACDRPVTSATSSASTAGTATAATTKSPPSTVSTDNATPTAPASTATIATSTAATGPGSHNAVADTLITGKVKAAIAADNGMKDSDISVKTENGIVTLSGHVKSPEQVTLAAALAQRQEGVSRVENQVAVK
jgi:hyperosmotically inducible protein